MFNYTRARLRILNDVITFSVATRLEGANGAHYVYKAFGESTHYPIIGTLVMLKSAPVTKFYLSWVRDVRGDRREEYLLESIEDGSLCWWSNVAYHACPGDIMRPEWTWSDEQYALCDRWYKHDDYLIRTKAPEFFEDGSVTLATRERWEQGSITSRTFPDYRHVKAKHMRSLIIESDRSMKAKYPQLKSVR